MAAAAHGCPTAPSARPPHIVRAIESPTKTTAANSSVKARLHVPSPRSRSRGCHAHPSAGRHRPVVAQSDQVPAGKRRNRTRAEAGRIGDRAEAGRAGAPAAPPSERGWAVITASASAAGRAAVAAAAPPSSSAASRAKGQRAPTAHSGTVSERLEPIGSALNRTVGRSVRLPRWTTQPRG